METYLRPETDSVSGPMKGLRYAEPEKLAVQAASICGAIVERGIDNMAWRAGL
jgi:hypothetical protein